MLLLWERSGAAVADLLLRLEQEGEILGEWRLGDPPLRMSVVDRVTGRVVATLAAEVPESQDVPAQEHEEAPNSVTDLLEEGALDSLSGVFHEPTAELPGLSNDPVPVAELGSKEGLEQARGRRSLGFPLSELNRIDPDRLDHSTTQDAPVIGLEETASVPGFRMAAAVGPVTAQLPEGLRESTESLPELGLETSGGMPELSLDPYTPTPVLGGLDEVPVPAVALGPLARHPGDDFTLPLPVAASEHTATGVVEETGAVPSTGNHEHNLTDDLIEVEGRAEVWSRRSGEWVLKGILVPGQRARMKEGSVKCLEDGGLMVTPGPVMRGTADVPGAEQESMKPGEVARRFPAGTAVTLWTGEQALYVRSDQPMEDISPVEYHLSRSESLAGYRPPKSDLELTGQGEI